MLTYFVALSIVCFLMAIAIIVQSLTSRNYENFILVLIVMVLWVIAVAMPTSMFYSIEQANEIYEERKVKITNAFYECVENGNELPWCVENVGSPVHVEEQE